MATPRILLAVDMSYQVYRAAAAHPMLTSRRRFTGGIYGFFSTFAKIVRETRATHVAFCRDMKPYRRSLLYPEYKQLRKANQDDELLQRYKESMDMVLDLFDSCGLETWGIEGFESDDLIGHCAVKYRHRFDKIYAASNDSDLFQLFSIAPNFFVYSKSLTDLRHAGNFHDAFGKPFTTDEFMLYHALQGTHNDIAGIDGVGPVTALKIVRNPSLLRQYRDSHGDLIERNLQLIRLPHPEFPAEARLPEHGKTFNPRKLYRSLDEYDIECTGSMLAAFEQLLRR